jgi:hypothetical protein
MSARQHHDLHGGRTLEESPRGSSRSAVPGQIEDGHIRSAFSEQLQSRMLRHGVSDDLEAVLGEK